MEQYVNVDKKEIAKFTNLAHIWWEKEGPMGMLHTINPLRLKFITSRASISNCKVLDVGCGGGILAEALAKSGAKVTGVDLAEETLNVAKQHSRVFDLDIDYKLQSVEETALKQPGEFDVITCMELLEHVPNPNEIVAACSRLLKPNGHAFFSTINRNIKSLLCAKIAAEYVLRIVPIGTHSYKKLIRPVELKKWAKENDLQYSCASSLIYNPLKKSFKIKDKEDVNYILHFVKK